MCLWVNPTHWPQLPTGHWRQKKQKTRAPLIPLETSKGVFSGPKHCEVGQDQMIQILQRTLEMDCQAGSVWWTEARCLRISPPIFLRYDTTIIFPKQLKFFSSDFSKHISPPVKPLHFNLPKDAPDRKFALCESYAAVHLNQVIAVGMLRKQPCHYFSNFLSSPRVFFVVLFLLFSTKKMPKKNDPGRSKVAPNSNWLARQLKSCPNEIWIERWTWFFTKLPES